MIRKKEDRVPLDRFLRSTAISGPAVAAAAQAKGSVVLIDGPRLATLMVEHGAGVSIKTLEVPQIDSDYFEND